MAEAVKDPRVLGSPEVFSLLVGDIMRYNRVTRAYAERLMGQAAVFLKAHADLIKAAACLGQDRPLGSGGRGLASLPQRTKPYFEFGMTHAGAYLHHLIALTETVHRLEATPCLDAVVITQARRG